MGLSFRYKLSNAINNIRSWNDRERSDIELLDQVTNVMKLSRALGLSISLVRVARRYDPSSYNYNCFMWAFGLLDRQWTADPVPESRDIYPRSDFANYLVSHYLQEVLEQDAKVGDIVIYFKDGKPVHAGTCESSLVVSKWGLYSHLWKHGLCELPIEYGDEIRFYQCLPDTIIREAFEKWGRHLRTDAPHGKDSMHPTIAPVLCTDNREINEKWMR